jgi:hypothetical protein
MNMTKSRLSLAAVIVLVAIALIIIAAPSTVEVIAQSSGGDGRNAEIKVENEVSNSDKANGMQLEYEIIYYSLALVI